MKTGHNVLVMLTCRTVGECNMLMFRVMLRHQYHHNINVINCFCDAPNLKFGMKSTAILRFPKHRQEFNIKLLFLKNIAQQIVRKPYCTRGKQNLTWKKTKNVWFILKGENNERILQFSNLVPRYWKWIVIYLFF